MLRLNIALAIALLLCALGLVTSQHHSRKQFMALEKAEMQNKQLETQWEQLQVEQSQLTKSAEIVTKAKRDLKMLPIDPDRTVHFAIGKETNPVTAENKSGNGNTGGAKR